MKHYLHYFVRTIMIFLGGMAMLVSGLPGQENVKIVGHCGYSMAYLENTEAAFIGAAEHGEDGIETDVRFTADGIPVTWHDHNITYSDGTTLIVSESTLAELTAKPIFNETNGDIAYLCTLEHYFEICKEYHLYCFLDMKGEWTEQQVTSAFTIAENTYDLDMCIPQSSNVENIKKVRAQYPDLQIMLTYGRNQFEDDLDYTVCYEYNFGIDADYTVMTEKMIKEFRSRGLPVAIFSCNTKLQYAYACYLGVDFMETDV